MRIFRVFHNYGAYEGWQIVGDDHDSILSAVEAREHDVENGGGESIIVEVIPVLEAYRRAAFETDDRKHLKQKEAEHIEEQGGAPHQP